MTKPDPLTLLSQNLPWVASADHLGHVLHQSGKMDQDAAVKRARFIDKTIGIRESFSFAYPDQVIRAVQVYACDGYGSMLYDFSSFSCESLFKSWNTCVKLKLLFESSSREVRHLARIVSRDIRSVTCRNVLLLKEATGLSPWDYSKRRIEDRLRKKILPEKDEWRPGLLLKLLEMRRGAEDRKNLDKMIESLCTT